MSPAAVAGDDPVPLALGTESRDEQASSDPKLTATPTKTAELSRVRRDEGLRSMALPEDLSPAAIPELVMAAAPPIDENRPELAAPSA
jgi:hypothetical protein